MNKEKTVIDFAVFVLMEIEELCSHVTDFFGQINYYDPFSEKILYEYEEFVRQEIDTSFIILNQEYNSNIETLNDLLNNEEIYNLLDYLNKNFTEGYPDGDGFGCNSNLDYKTDDLYILFNNYLELRKYNKNVFLTYFIQLINNLQYGVKKENTEKVINDILYNEKIKKSLNLSLETEYLENKKNEYRQKLIDKNQFQLKGVINANEINLDIKQSLVSCLEFLNDGGFNEKYSVYYNSVLEYSFDYMIHQFLEEKLLVTRKTKNDDEKKDNYFKIGLLLAKGELKIKEKIKGNEIQFIYLDVSYTSANSVAEVIAKKINLKQTSVQTIISATISNSHKINDNRNIFDIKKIKKVESIYSYCEKNGIQVSEYFNKKLTDLRHRHETL